MIALPEAQSAVLAALLGRGDARRAAALLRPTRGIPPERRLQVYRNHLFDSLTAALGAVYPVVARLVGEPFFRALARRFIVAHPSRSGSLLGFGRGLPAFLRADPAVAGLPYLGDVAALEWACHEVYHEADLPALEPSSLARVPTPAEPRLRLHLAPAARFVRSPFPVLRLWQANQAGHGDALPPVALAEGGVELLVARRDGEIEFRSLAAGECRWLRALAAGLPLAPATELALGRDPAFDLGAALARHVRLGTFTTWSIAPPAATAPGAAGSERAS